MIGSSKADSRLLIVVDMQNDFVNGVLGTPEARAIVPKVVERVHKANVDNEQVMFTRDTHYNDYLNTKEGQWLNIPHCIKDTYGWEIIDELNPKYIKAFNKHSFASMSLASSLASRGLKTIEIIGLCTDICVLSTAVVLRSFFPDLDIKVNSACCAGTTPEKHQQTLEVLKGINIEII